MIFSGISKWVRQRIQHYRNFNQAIGSLKDFADARQLIPCPATQTPKSATKTSSSSTADGSFLSDTSPNREEHVTPSTSTPLAPTNEFNSPFNHSLESPGHQSIGDHSSQCISTPVSHSKHAGPSNIMTSEPHRSIVNVNTLGTNTVVNQVFLNAQPQTQTIPLQLNSPMTTNVNSQVPQRFVFIPTNALGIPRNLNPSIINTRGPIRANSPTVLRANTPLGVHRPQQVQQVLYLTPIQLNKQSIRAQTPGASFVYTTPKTIVFTSPRNGPSQINTTQNQTVAVANTKEQLTQGSIFNKSLPSEVPPSTNFLTVDRSRQENYLTKENIAIKTNEPCTTDSKCSMPDQTEATSSGRNANISCEQASDDKRATDNGGVVDRNKWTQEESNFDLEGECPKQPQNVRDVNQEFSRSEQSNIHQPIENVVLKKCTAVDKAGQQIEVDIRDVEFPESPDMFSTPSPQTDIVMNCADNNDLIAENADTKSAVVSGRPSDHIEIVHNAMTIPPVNTVGNQSVDQSSVSFEVNGENPSHVCHELSTKDVKDSKTATEVREEGVDCEKESTMTSKKMRVESNVISVRTRTSRRSVDKDDSNLREPQEREITVAKREIPEEKTPVRRNLRRTAQRQGTITTKAMENRRDGKSVSEDKPAEITTSICCKHCNTQLFKGNFKNHPSKTKVLN
jgi:hypothetical protein